MELINKELKKNHEKYVKLLKARDDAHEKVLSKSTMFTRGMLQKKYEVAVKEFDEFTANVYAKAVFEILSKTKPSLIRVRTGESFEWEEMFGFDFNKISEFNRGILVGLVEDCCGYKFK